MDRPIGIIDSGIGGLSIWKTVTKLLPNESVLYIGDQAHMPYSNQTQVFIRHRVLTLLKYLQSQRVKLVIIACNTATVAGIDVYRTSYPDMPIIGVVPVIKTAVRETVTGHIAVLSTEFTAKSKYLKKLIDKYAGSMHVQLIGLTNLVSHIEKGEVTQQMYDELQKSLLALRRTDTDVVVLGCTHYPLIRRIFSLSLGKKIRLLDSAEAVARHCKRILEENDDLCQISKPEYGFYTTGNAVAVNRASNFFLHKKFVFTHIDL